MRWGANQVWRRAEYSMSMKRIDTGNFIGKYTPFSNALSHSFPWLARRGRAKNYGTTNKVTWSSFYLYETPGAVFGDAGN